MTVALIVAVKPFNIPSEETVNNTPKVVDGSEDLLLVTQSGTLIRTDVDGIRMVGRASQGVIVMRFKDEGDKVVAMSLAEKEPGEDEPQSENGAAAEE